MYHQSYDVVWDGADDSDRYRGWQVGGSNVETVLGMPLSGGADQLI